MNNSKFIFKILLQFICVCLFFTFKTNKIFASTYYCSISGSDNNDGTSPSSAWSTLDKINSFEFSPGDTISFRGSDKFYGSINKTLKFDNSNDFLVFNSFGNGKAAIECLDTANDCVTIQFTKHIAVAINNLILIGKYNAQAQTGSVKSSRGIHIFNYNTLKDNEDSKAVIQNCEISNFKNSGINVVSGDFAKIINAKIDGNNIHDCGTIGIELSFIWYSKSVISNNIIHDIYGIKKGSSIYTGIGIQMSLCKQILCEGNLIYNMGKYADTSGLGIVTGASKSITVRSNEIYNIYCNHGYDGEAIDFDNGSDSCIAEYNFIHDTQGVGALISGSSAVSFNSNRIPNIKNMDLSSSDYNTIRYNIFKECGTKNHLMTIKIGSGNKKYPATNNLIYNNTIIKKNTGATNYAITLTFSQKGTGIYNNIILTDKVAFLLIDKMSNKSNLSISNNCYWDISKYAKVIIVSPTYLEYDLESWIDTYDAERISGVKVEKFVNPQLKNPFTTSDMVNNPSKLDTLSAYTLLKTSPLIGKGLNLEALYGINPGTQDFYGNKLKTNGKYDIGAYEHP